MSNVEYHSTVYGGVVHGRHDPVNNVVNIGKIPVYGSAGERNTSHTHTTHISTHHTHITPTRHTHHTHSTHASHTHITHITHTPHTLVYIQTYQHTYAYEASTHSCIVKASVCFDQGLWRRGGTLAWHCTNIAALPSQSAR